MDTMELIREISDKDVDVDKFVQMAIRDEGIRDEIVNQMVTNPDIMAYYHCYYVVDKASRVEPELFYKYWKEMVALLGHKNSYHRDIALTVIANLTRVDREDLFSGVFSDYFEHINDVKFMTGQCCVRNSIKILESKPELRERVIGLLLDVENRCTYSDKQKALLKCDVLEIFDQVFDEASDNERVAEFIREGIDSISPKTRNKARELVGKYAL